MPRGTPRRRRELTPEQQAERRTRVSSYQARIERTLTDIFIEVPPHANSGSVWRLVGVGHTRGYAVCELCGHNPIRRLFFIRADGPDAPEQQGDPQELMIGSECATNYVGVDLVNAYMRSLVRQQGRNRQQEERAERTRAREEGRRLRETARNRAREEWARANADLVRWLELLPVRQSSTFLNDLHRSYVEYGSLTERQTEVALERMVEWNSRQEDRPANALSLAATADEVTHLFNGTYTMSIRGDASWHDESSLLIYTVRRGPLEGRRILKRRVGSMWQGFAFVGRDGSLVLWRRFEEQRHEQYVRRAELLLQLMNASHNRVSDRDEFTWDAPNSSERWRIQRSRNCRRCNRELTRSSSIDAGLGPECARIVGVAQNAAEEGEDVILSLDQAPPGREYTIQRMARADGTAWGSGNATNTRSELDMEVDANRSRGAVAYIDGETRVWTGEQWYTVGEALQHDADVLPPQIRDPAPGQEYVDSSTGYTYTATGNGSWVRSDPEFCECSEAHPSQYSTGVWYCHGCNRRLTPAAGARAQGRRDYRRIDERRDYQTPQWIVNHDEQSNDEIQARSVFAMPPSGHMAVADIDQLADNRSEATVVLAHSRYLWSQGDAVWVDHRNMVRRIRPSAGSNRLCIVVASERNEATQRYDYWVRLRMPGDPDTATSPSGTWSDYSSPQRQYTTQTQRAAGRIREPDPTPLRHGSRILSMSEVDPTLVQ